MQASHRRAMNITNKNNVQLPRRLNIELGVWGRRKGRENDMYRQMLETTVYHLEKHVGELKSIAKISEEKLIQNEIMRVSTQIHVLKTGIAIELLKETGK